MSNFFRDVEIIANYWYYYFNEYAILREAMCNEIEEEVSKLKNVDDIEEAFQMENFFYVQEMRFKHTDELQSIYNMEPNEELVKAVKKLSQKQLFTLYRGIREKGYHLFNLLWTAYNVYLEIRRGTEITKELIYDNSLSKWATIHLTMLTPQEVEQLFPIPKEYDGNRYGWRDYYSDIEASKELGYTKMMGEEKALHYIMNCNSHPFFTEVGVELMSIALEYANKDIIEVLEEINTKLKLEQELLDMINNK